MKKQLLKQPLLFVALFAMLIIGCKENPKEAEAEVEAVEAVEVDNTLTDAQFKKIWEKDVALWETQDPALINTVFAENFTRTSPGGTSTNAEELSSELRSVGIAFPGLKLNLNHYDICDNMVSVHWSVSGDFTGEIAGLKGNGKPYNVIGISVIFVEDGKIVKDESYWDTYAVFAQAGGYKIVPE